MKILRWYFCWSTETNQLWIFQKEEGCVCDETCGLAGGMSDLESSPPTHSSASSHDPSGKTILVISTTAWSWWWPVTTPKNLPWVSRRVCISNGSTLVNWQRQRAYSNFLPKFPFASPYSLPINFFCKCCAYVLVLSWTFDQSYLDASSASSSGFASQSRFNEESKRRNSRGKSVTKIILSSGSSEAAAMSRFGH